MHRVRSPLAVLLLLLLFTPRLAHAEPYLAVLAGLKCSACHVNPTGGGMRNTFGTVWGQTSLPARMLEMSAGPWTGEISRYVGIGADFRASGSSVDYPGSPSSWSFNIDNLRAYVDLRVIPERLSLYIDERLSPGNVTNQEAYLRLWSKSHRYYAKVGQFYLPFGIRLQDDSAFTRELTGINFNTPDRGVELGMDGTHWTGQFALTNGTAGASEVDNGKQWSLRAEYVSARWRAGGSFNFNDFESGPRRMQGLFGALHTGPVAWLAEADYIVDSTGTQDRKQWVGLLEADWNYRKGQNLKLTAEMTKPDDAFSDNRQSRLSLVWEYTPIPFVQIRAGARLYDDSDEVAFLNPQIFFLQIHGYL